MIETVVYKKKKEFQISNFKHYASMIMSHIFKTVLIS